MAIDETLKFAWSLVPSSSEAWKKDLESEWEFMAKTLFRVAVVIFGGHHFDDRWMGENKSVPPHSFHMVVRETPLRRPGANVCLPRDNGRIVLAVLRFAESGTTFSDVPV